jgi:tetratricopeptide (TPR) repeat protein
MRITKFKAFSILVGSILVAHPMAASMQEDSVDILLMDKDVQIDATQAVNDMYNFKFEKADRQFRWLAQDYPDHPLPYFLLALSQWWRMAPNIDNVTYDDAFMQYIDQSLDLAHKMYDKNPENVEANFFLAAGYGFKGRLLAERKSWRKAALAGKNALKYLENSSNQSDLSPEFLFGDALYNYYSVWIPENYPILKPILVFFKKGDKELGIQQLQEVANNAFYTRTEAQSYLMRILAIEEQELIRALQVSEYLSTTFPDNSYFQRFYARLLYTTGKHWQAEKESLNIIQKIDSGKVGYGPVTGRYAAFFLGQIYTHKSKFEEAAKYYYRAVEFAEQSEDLESGYYLFSLIGLGDIAQQTGDIKGAKEFYKRVKKEAKSSHPAHERAKDRLKGIES